MAQFPALPLWTDAYLADTGHLTTLEHGAYLMLLMSMWRAGGELPNDDRKLARFAKLTTPQWLRIKDTIMEFMTVSEDGLTVSQGRLGDELQYVRDHSKKQARNSRQRWENRTATPGPVGQHPNHLSDASQANPLKTLNEGDAMGMPDASQTDAPTPTPTIVDTNVSTLSDPAVSDRAPLKPKKGRNGYTVEFEAFWSAYPSTEGQSKLNGFKAWQRLRPDQQVQAMASLPAYAAHLKAESWRKVKHVQGYLSGRMFETMGADAVTELETPIQWQKRLGHARARHEWFPVKWGPVPGAAGCRVPSDLLQPGDGEGWQEARAA
ncbi:MAG: YdaU family protein [Devosia sp.]|nr:YdaU family protein [Devosia sp.]